MNRVEYVDFLIENTNAKDEIPARRRFYEHLLAAGLILPDDQGTRPVRTGYMCKVDFDFELGAAVGGNVIYASPEDAKDHRKCVDSCGLVEVEVRLKQVVIDGKDNG